VMVSHKEHRQLCKLLLGKSREDIHRLLDFPYRVLGPRHRILLHTPLVAAVIALSGDPEGGKAALIHILQDRAQEVKRKWRKFVRVGKR